MYKKNTNYNQDSVDFDLISTMEFDEKKLEEGFGKIGKPSMYNEKVGWYNWTVRNVEVEKVNAYGKKTHVISFINDSGLPGEDYIFYFQITAASFDVTRLDIVKILAFINTHLHNLEGIALQKNWNCNYGFATSGALGEIKEICTENSTEQNEEK